MDGETDLSQNVEKQGQPASQGWVLTQTSKISTTGLAEVPSYQKLPSCYINVHFVMVNRSEERGSHCQFVLFLPVVKATVVISLSRVCCDLSGNWQSLCFHAFIPLARMASIAHWGQWSEVNKVSILWNSMHQMYASRALLTLTFATPFSWEDKGRRKGAPGLINLEMKYRSVLKYQWILSDGAQAPFYRQGSDICLKEVNSN